ncbi:MAG: esterase [Planctomycetes bacterium]|nr:esterase [Planctomycetota bacterium]
MPGTVILETIESRVLRGNPLGDPFVRRVPVYLPPSYSRSGRRYPVIYVLTGFTGSGEMLENRTAWSEKFSERCDRLIRSGKMGESIVAMPDCFTRYGGSQYLNSSATGRYEDHLVREVVPFIDTRYRTISSAKARAVMGKSSGGYGALVQGMRHPDVFGLVCCTSGDMYFPYCYVPDFPKALGVFAKHGGSAAAFLRKWKKMPKRADASLFPAVNTIAMAACYSPNARAEVGFDLPMDEKTGELRRAVWRRWLALDPVTLVGRYARNLKKLSLLFLDCGTRDEFHLHYGMRIFHRKATALGIPHRVEEFDDTHMNIQYRYDRSLELISKAMIR